MVSAAIRAVIAAAVIVATAHCGEDPDRSETLPSSEFAKLSRAPFSRAGLPEGFTVLGVDSEESTRGNLGLVTVRLEETVHDDRSLALLILTAFESRGAAEEIGGVDSGCSPGPDDTGLRRCSEREGAVVVVARSRTATEDLLEAGLRHVRRTLRSG